MQNQSITSYDQDLIKEILTEEVKEFNLSNNVVQVYNRHDAVITLAVLECLNYTAVECMTDWGFNKGVIEIIFN